MANSRISGHDVYNGPSRKISSFAKGLEIKPGFMPAHRKPMLNRRSFLNASLFSGSAFFLGFAGVAWPSSLRPQQRDPSTNGMLLGTLDFIDEGSAPLDVVEGAELDGRLYSDLSKLGPENPVTPTEKFYIRTCASKLLPDPATWQVKLAGLIDRPINLGIDNLRKAAKPMGTHLMECAGNVRQARFGLLSVGEWAGVPVLEILDKTKATSRSARVLISGFDRYSAESRTSVPGASWVFSREQLENAGAFLATELDGQPLPKDHGAPVRLVVPGWYGCTSIKWVDEINLVEHGADATSQMREYAARTLQKGVPQLAKDFAPASIEQAAMPIRIEKWSVAGKVHYRVVGIAWGGSQPVKVLEIRFNPDEDYVAVDNFHQVANHPWTFWTHNWSPKTPGTYFIHLSVKQPAVEARRLDSGYYVRSVAITEV
jgi:DMSO/TMAO reductase YedYZ molybdopterin-dependent catalytic subunit